MNPDDFKVFVDGLADYDLDYLENLVCIAQRKRIRDRIKLINLETEQARVKAEGRY